MSFDPRTNIRCLSLQLWHQHDPAWQDSQVALRPILEPDGTCRLIPLYLSDVGLWVDLVWEAELPTPYLWSTSP